MSNVLSIRPTWGRHNYHEYLKTPQWKARAAHMKQTVGCRCQECGKTFPPQWLDVHHNTYDRLGHEWDSDLIVLCSYHHSKFHAEQLHGERWRLECQQLAKRAGRLRVKVSDIVAHRDGVIQAMREHLDMFDELQQMHRAEEACLREWQESVGERRAA